jgi:hypothetical protein
MNFTKCFAAALTAFLLLPTAAFAEDKDKETSTEGEYHSQIPRYEFEIEPGNILLFREPVSYTGEVIATSDHDRTIRAANGMTIRIPNQALVWNGDRNMFNQETKMGDTVVVHMRPEESYRIMKAPSVIAPMMAIGSYDGVYYFSREFIADLDLEHLDNNIYANRSSKEKGRVYDIDLSSFDGDGDSDSDNDI